MENKYERGKIYKLVNKEFPDLVYYGSTIQKLNRRLKDHKAHNKKKNLTTKILFTKGECKIILVENYPCKSKLELEQKERIYIETNKCINKNIPGRTIKEYYNDNKDKILEKAKITNKQSYNKNKEQILKIRIEYYQNNKDKICEKQKIKITCECGSTFRRCDKARHEKSKKHVNYINKII